MLFLRWLHRSGLIGWAQGQARPAGRAV